MMVKRMKVGDVSRRLLVEKWAKYATVKTNARLDLCTCVAHLRPAASNITRTAQHPANAISAVACAVSCNVIRDLVQHTAGEKRIGVFRMH
ncbi:unnamed protein product [Leptidea sinapis]|uniref:Uncharacterized protein n=1 Tax=Leptidea sinapis TaxID=189913 RepID=A0A5E4Q2J2_9NEOP|nr:unnamed protein product [Leptidea sinapis]